MSEHPNSFVRLTMNRRGREREPPHQSSLPSSLIPHLLYSQHRDSSTRTTLEGDESPPHHDRSATIYLNPVSPVPLLRAPLSSAPPLNHGRSSLSDSQERLDTGDRLLNASSSSLSQQSNTSMHHALDPSMPPTMSQHFTSPIYSDPVFHTSSRPAMSFRTPIYTFPPPPSQRDVLFERMSWREGEAGPSSLLHPASDAHGPGGHRRKSSYSLRASPRPELHARGMLHYDQSSSSSDLRDDLEGDSYIPPIQTGRHTPQMAHFQALPPTSQLPPPSRDDPSFPFDRQDMYSYPSVGSLSISAPSPTHMRESPEMSPVRRSESRSGETASNDGDDSQRGKRRRTESVETDDNARKSRNPRKTAVACNFCRGRKLRCNGVKPSCYNCTVRKFECEYVPIQRRRGPGKAPKGTRSKKASASRSDPSGSSSQITGDRPSGTVPDYELEALAPELRPYTSVLSLDDFGFQPPEPSPQYPSAPDPYLRRGHYSRARTPRSRETSSEDRSDTEEMYGKMH